MVYTQLGHKLVRVEVELCCFNVSYENLQEVFVHPYHLTPFGTASLLLSIYYSNFCTIVTNSCSGGEI